MTKEENFSKYSEYIGNFLNAIEEAKKLHRIAEEQVDIEEKRKVDIEHKIELNTEGYKRRHQLSKELETCLRRRRKYKNDKERAEPLRKFANDHKKAIEALKQVLGEQRRVEQYHANRTYKPRIKE